MENVIPGHPKEEGLLELVASRPLRLQDEHDQSGEKLWLPSVGAEDTLGGGPGGSGRKARVPRSSQRQPGEPGESPGKAQKWSRRVAEKLEN